MASTSTSSASSSDSEHEQPAVTETKVKKVVTKDDSDDSSDSSDSEAGDAEPAEEEVPVLSHAELRRQKRKEQKAKERALEKDNDAGKSKQKKVKNTAELAPSKVPKRQNSVWIGNLSFKTTPDALRQFFDGVGEITRVHMPMKMATGGPGRGGAVKENRGFAYVDFASPEAKTIAITLSENHLDGRRLLIKDGDDYSGRPSTSADGAAATTDGEKNLTGHTKTAQKILRQQKQPAGPTLFLGNLGFETTEQSIRSLFESHHVKELKAEDKEAMDVDQKDGEVKEVKEKGAKNWIRKIRMGTFEDSGKCKGWAFVDFLTTEDATTALVNPKNHFLDGRKLVVEYGSPEAVRRGGAGSRGEKGKGRPSSGPGKQDEEGTGTDKPRRERVRPVRKRDAEDGGEQPAKRRKSEGEGADGGAAEDGSSGAYPSRREMRGSRDARPKVRAKPGAALANAKREAVSIVPSQGKKIVF